MDRERKGGVSKTRGSRAAGYRAAFASLPGWRSRVDGSGEVDLAGRRAVQGRRLGRDLGARNGGRSRVDGSWEAGG
jgi:hypothetical protein